MHSENLPNLTHKFQLSGSMNTEYPVVCQQFSIWIVVAVIKFRCRWQQIACSAKFGTLSDQFRVCWIRAWTYQKLIITAVQMSRMIRYTHIRTRCSLSVKFGCRIFFWLNHFLFGIFSFEKSKRTMIRKFDGTNFRHSHCDEFLNAPKNSIKRRIMMTFKVESFKMSSSTINSNYFSSIHRASNR